MAENKIEQRHHKRMYFSIKDGLIGTFTFPGLEKEILSGTIMDLGAGGMCLSYTKNQNVALLVGGRMVLLKVKGTTGLRSLSNVQVIVRWVIELESSKNVTFGCQFVTLASEDRDTIQEFIDSWEVS